MSSKAKAGQPDLSEFFKYSRPKRKPCAVGYALGELSPEEATQLEAACARDTGLITAGSIQQWLAVRKIETSVSAITFHRKGMCTCGDAA